MPKKSGHKLLYELRKDKLLSRIPFVVVTAHAQDELGKDDLDDIMQNRVVSGPGTYLEKPIKPLDYVRCVQRGIAPCPCRTQEEEPMKHRGTAVRQPFMNN
jgi:CheY-like chemotaxis protein